MNCILYLHIGLFTMGLGHIGKISSPSYTYVIFFKTHCPMLKSVIVIIEFMYLGDKMK